jgi:hypothetical protein
VGRLYPLKFACKACTGGAGWRAADLCCAWCQTQLEAPSKRPESCGAVEPELGQQRRKLRPIEVACGRPGSMAPRYAQVAGYQPWAPQYKRGTSQPGHFCRCGAAPLLRGLCTLQVPPAQHAIRLYLAVAGRGRSPVPSNPTPTFRA